MSCSICDNKTGEIVFCEYHEVAYKNIKEAFKSWQKAMNIEWMEYLKRIIEHDFTGKWVREVAEFLIRNETNIS